MSTDPCLAPLQPSARAMGRTRIVKWCVLLFAIGLVVRLALVFLTSSYLKTGRFEMERAALSLAAHGTLADPYLIPTGPTAHVPPGYALFLAAIYRVFGAGLHSEIVKQFCSAAASSAGYALLPLLCPVLGIGQEVGLAAAVFGAALPLKLSTEVLGDWEAPYAALALTLLAWRTALTWKGSRFGLRRGFPDGAGWGLALLVSPSLFPILAVWLGVGFRAVARRSRGPYLAYCGALLTAAALCLAPWAVRNQRQLGAAIFTRSNFGLEMYVSNNDRAGPLEFENYRRGVYHSFHPLLSLREARDVRAMGEVAYNRDRLRRAFDWIGRNPARFARLTAERAFYTWFPETPTPWRDVLFVPLVIASILGLAVLWRRNRTTALMLGGAMLAYTLLYYLVQVNVRYRYPIDWIVLLTATYFVAEVSTGAARRRRKRSGVPAL